MKRRPARPQNSADKQGAASLEGKTREVGWQRICPLAARLIFNCNIWVLVCMARGYPARA